MKLSYALLGLAVASVTPTAAAYQTDVAAITGESVPFAVEIDASHQPASLTEVAYPQAAGVRQINGDCDVRFDVAETGGRLGFISPLSHNFCENCNRVRITCTGQLYTCLGHDGMRDLKPALRNGCTQEAIDDAIDDALARKPKGHDFDISRRGQAPSVHRHMSVTGG